MDSSSRMTTVISAVSKKGGAGRTRAIVELAKNVGKDRPDVLVVVIDLDPQAHTTRALVAGTSMTTLPQTAIGLLTRPERHPALDYFCRLAPNLLLLPGDARLELLSAQMAHPVLVVGNANGECGFAEWIMLLRDAFKEIEAFAVDAGFRAVLGLIDTAPGFGVDPLSLLATATSNRLLVPVSATIESMALDSAKRLLGQVERLRAGDLDEIWAYRAVQCGFKPHAVFPKVSLLLFNGRDAEEAAGQVLRVLPVEDWPACVAGFGADLFRSVVSALRMLEPCHSGPAKRQRLEL